jgi:putative peptide zinc metalloprotease protein
VAALRPGLRSHARIHRHRYRGETWYVLHDRSTERFHRFSPEAYAVIGLMDGRRTVQEIWDAASALLGDDAPTQGEVIHLLSQLHAGDALQCDVPPDAGELLERHERHTRRRWQGKLLSLFSWQFSVLDPERLLQRLAPVLSPLTGWAGALLWLLVVGPAAVLLAVHWTDLTRNVLGRVLAPQSLVLLWLLFPVVKVLHELGHAAVTKAHGGEVHDMGVMLLVLTPAPYVDASAAWAFPDKWRRIAVGAAGMMVDLFIAALALFLWLAVEPGVVRTLAFNAILIVGISTVLFNANPLLRFDGYYMLADWLEIPNLRQRANGYLAYLAERYLFGRREAEAPAAAPGERPWFVGYAIASFAYRIVVVTGILLFLGERLFFVAVPLALLTAVAWVGVPAGKGLAYLFASPRLREVRVRALAVTVLLVATVAAAVGLVPVPFRSRVEGVIWVPDESVVRPGTEGFVERVLAAPGSRVRRGDAVVLLRDPMLPMRVRELEARRRELEARLAEQQPVDRVKAQMIQEELGYVTRNLAEARQRVSELTVRSGVGGTFVLPAAEDLPGRFVKKGELLGFVVELGTITVRVVVPQAEVDLVRRRARQVEVRLVERLDERIAGTITRIVPGGSERLPSSALGSEGGGQIAVDPRDQKGTTAVARVFQVDVELDNRARTPNVGGRAHVRFDHGREPLAAQWYQQLRQLFLARLNV